MENEVPSETKRRKIIEETVVDILKHANLETATEHGVRTAAAEHLGVDRFDLHHKLLIRGVIESFLLSTTTSTNKAQEEIEATHQKETAEAPVLLVQQQQPLAQDINNGRIICNLSDKRLVAIHDFRGQSLVSIRDYHQKDGKQFPSARGISLTTKQWSSFRSCVPAIEEAIVKMKSQIRLQVVRKPSELDISSSVVDSPQGLAASDRKQREVAIPNSSSVLSPQEPISKGRSQTEVYTNPPNHEHQVASNNVQLQSDTSPSLSALAFPEHLKRDSLISFPPPRLVPIEPTRLNGNNYYCWKHQMEFFLGQMKLAYVLSEPCPSSSSDTPGSTLEETGQAKAAAQKWVDDDYICHHNILNSLSDTLYDKYSKKSYSARELWEELKSVYEEDFGTKRSELNKYVQFQMVDCVSVLDQLQELHKIAHSIMASGIWIDEYFHVSVILSKLPPSWREFRQRLMREEFLPLNMLMHRVKVEEEVRNGYKKEKSSKNAHVIRSKLESKVGSRNRERKRLCYTCCKEGHLSEHCPDRKFEIRGNGNVNRGNVIEGTITD